MIARDLIELLARSTLLLAAVWVAAAAVRKAGGSAAMLHLVWLLGLGALLLLPLLSALVPQLRLPILPVTDAAANFSAPVSGAWRSTPSGSGIVGSLDLAGLARVVWLAIVAALLARLILGYQLLARAWRRAEEVPDQGWIELLRQSASSLGIRRPVTLRVAEGAAMPMTWGTIRPKILLPAQARGWTEDRRRVVLLHELAHVARRDSFSQTAVAVLAAFYWLQPAIWLAARRMRVEQEHACDDLVLAMGADANAYARTLLEVAAAFRPPVGAALFVPMARASELERRLKAVIGHTPRRRPTSGLAASYGFTALLVTSIVAAVAPVARLQSSSGSPPVRQAFLGVGGATPLLPNGIGLSVANGGPEGLPPAVGERGEPIVESSVPSQARRVSAGEDAMMHEGHGRHDLSYRDPESLSRLRQSTLPAAPPTPPVLPTPPTLHTPPTLPTPPTTLSLPLPPIPPTPPSPLPRLSFRSQLP
jgi:beta-lactamase regulating signal transducer with metallopeptidase domain